MNDRMTSQAGDTTETRDGQRPVLYQRLDTTAKYPYSAGEYTKRFLWEIVQATLVRFSPSRAWGWRNFWLRLFGAQLAQGAKVRPTTYIKHPWLLTMGEYSVIAENTQVYNLGPITIGNHTVISQDVYLCAGTHDYTKPDLPLIRASITIGSGVWICAGAFLCPNVSIGTNSVVGARAVVTKDVPEAVVVGGNPAKVLHTRTVGSAH